MPSHVEESRHGYSQTAIAMHAEGQQHPIRIYLIVWFWLFVLSACSYLVDYFGFVGLLRGTLIVVFMLLKAGLIVAAFVHVIWERLALGYAILLPPIAELVFCATIALESYHTLVTPPLFSAGLK